MNNKLELSNDYKNILVTGGSGFIGGTVIRKLLKETEFNIFNLDKIGYASDEITIKNYVESNPKLKKRYQLLKVDLNELNDVKKAIRVSDPDLVLHLAAESHVDRSIDDPSVFIESNIKGTFNLLEATLNHFKNLNYKRSSFFKFVHISTDEVFGSLNDHGKFCENSPYDPRSPYSASKASSDHLVSAWFHTFNLPTITTHCSNNYGPYQFPEKLIPLTILKAINNEEIPLYGDGKNIRDWLHVEDHVEGIIKVLNYGKIGSKYCIGGVGEKSNLEVVEMICSKLDKLMNSEKPHKRLITFVNDRPGHDKRYSIDSSLIRNELGWNPKHDFETGLENTINWYLRNLSWCKEVIKN